MQPIVSVIIPTYNYGHFIEGTINSVLSQTFTGFEVIVVDDGSTDNTGEIVKQFGDKVRYIWQENGGPNKARNTGIRAARGQHIGFLDADDRWLPEKLELQLHLIQRDPKIGLVYSRVYKFDESGVIFGHYPLGPCCRGKVMRQLYMRQVIAMSSTLVRREVFDHVGLFNKNVTGPDDWDMWLRIAARYEFDFVSQPLALYRIHTSWARNKNPEKYEKETLAFLNQIADDNPKELHGLKEVRLSSFIEMLGWRYICGGDLSSGRKRLIQAIRYKRSRLRPYILLFLSYFMYRITPERLKRHSIEYAHGEYYLFNYDLKQARKCFLNAIKAHPLNSTMPYIRLLIALSGPRVVKKIREKLKLKEYCTIKPPGQDLSYTLW